MSTTNQKTMWKKEGGKRNKKRQRNFRFLTKMKIGMYDIPMDV